MLLRSNVRSGRPILLLPLVLISSFWQHAHGLSQTYCSSQNTGSNFDAVSNIYQSNGACQQTCAASYAFAVVQYQQCWCSNYAPANQLDVTECSQGCPGYPDESCGNKDNGLYGYIQLSINPSGTQGSGSGSGSGSSASSTTSVAQSSTEQPTTISSSSPSSAPASSSEQSDTTVFTPVSVTVTVKQSASVVVSYVTPTSSREPSTTSSSSTSSSTSSTSVSITSTKGAGVTSSPPSATSSLSHTTLVSTRVVTVSGGPVTQTVTSTAVVTPGADSQNHTEQKSVSSGTVAGAIVGSVAGIALLFAGAFFLWRRKRSGTADPESPLSSTGSNSARRRVERNTSVLSKTGLLSSAGNAVDMEKFHDDSAPFGAAGHKYNSTESNAAVAASHDGENRRNSRPLVYDQRLNPAALMENWERNGSRASIGTMQDQRDYSRPLGVTNPDPVDD